MSKIQILIILGFLCSLSIQAQTIDVSDTLALETVLVTASKIPTELRETTKSAIVIDQQTISRSLGKDLSQLLNEQVGINVNGAFSNPGKDKSLFIQGASSKYTLFLIDGMAINDPNGLGGASDPRNFSLDNIERIEVVKGSMSTLYGTDAIAGVINIITKKTAEKEVQVNGSSSYGSFGSYKGALGLSGSTKGGSYSINISREGSEGISEAKNEAENEVFDNDGFERDAVAIRTNIQLAEGFEISPFVNYSGFNGDYDSGSFTDGNETYSSIFWNPGLFALYETGAFKVNAGYNYTSSKLSYTSNFGTSEFEGKLQNLDVYGAYFFGENITALAGLNYQYAQIDGLDAVLKNPASDIYSPYATAMVKNWNGFNGEFGVRLNSHSEYGTNSTFGISGSYDILEHVKILASFGTGYRAPNVAELFGAFGANPNLAPEKSRYFNFGIEGFLLENRLKTSINYFNRSIDDVIIYLFPEGYVNQDQQDDQGIEYAISYLTNEMISINANYNYLTGTLTSKDASGNKVTSNDLIRRPTHSFGIGLEIRPSAELSVQINGSYLGERKDNFFNTIDFSSSIVTLEAYSILNMYVEYKLQNGNMAFFTDIKNLLGANYTEVYGYNTVGFSGNAGVRFTF